MGSKGRRRHARLLITGIAAGLCLLGLSQASASSANISKSYSTSTEIAAGSLVSLDKSKSGYVEPANVSNGSRLIGVAVATNDSLLAVDAGGGRLQVANSGTANALVSTLNGDLKVGDQIGVSPFSGIGMKAAGGSHIIGVAQTDLNSKTEGASTKEVTDRDGAKQTIQVGLVRVSISPGISTADNDSAKLNFLQRVVKSLTGRTIPTIRIVLALVVALVALITMVALIYSAIYGSIISIGRNPLAKQAVYRTLASVLVMVAITAALAGVTIFFLLR